MLEYLTIKGGVALDGQVRVSGAKNSALPLLFATLLTPEECILENVPDLEDISVTLRILSRLGAEAKFVNNKLVIKTPRIKSTEASYSLVKKLRASFWLLGPLLARAGNARIALPGGDAIGTRPVDLHIKGLMKLGADIRLQNGIVIATAPGGLKGDKVILDFPSVGATHNLLMTAALIPGETVIEGAAREPEVVELCEFLKQMGAVIEGAGTSSIHIQGRTQLTGASCQIIGDRIEAATYLAAAAITGGKITVQGISPTAVGKTIEILEQSGCKLLVSDDEIAVRGPRKLQAVSFDTAPYPGLATDVQPILMAMLTKAEGTSLIKETIFESRFGHVAEYRRFGADIAVDGRLAVVKGVSLLSAAPVDALDIRAAAGLVVMALAAEGKTTISDIFHLDRGYENLTQKLISLGAVVERVPVYESKEIVVGC